MQQNLAPTFIATPHGITIDSIPLNKSTSRKLSPETLRYVKRAQELLATVKKEDWDNRTPHATHDFPALGKAQMMLALASPQSFPSSLNRQNWQELTKDASDDSDDEDNDSEDDSSNSDSSDDDSYSGGGGGHYNPDEPRIPAGQPGGGQWTTAGNGTSADAGGISADDVRTALMDGLKNPSALPIGTLVADSNEIMTDANIYNSDILGYPNGESIIDPNTGKPYPAPSGMNILDNIEQGESANTLDMINWFQHFGPMDYQRSTGVFNSDYTNVTNYNYGAVSAAAGYSLDETLSNAGLYNRYFGNTNNTDVLYGLRQSSIANITQGWQDYHQIWSKKKAS